MAAGKDILKYDGKRLHWNHPGDGNPAAKYKATSGFTRYQIAAKQCTKNAGPIPEGTYSFRLVIDPKKYARDDGKGQCNLRPSQKIQQIPRGARAGSCERYWSNWGWNRVRIEAADTKTRKACSPRRGGFYLHDSTKGYTHGCIEVEQIFFNRIVKYAKKAIGKKLYLVVDYAFTSTYGSTKKP